MNPHLIRDMDSLKMRIVSLAATVEQSVHNAMRGVINRDAELARRTIERDKEVDLVEVEIEEDCLKVLALHQTVAHDLRWIITVMKVNGELESIGDCAKNISERTILLTEQDVIPVPRELELMGKKTEAMLRKALDSFINNDANSARTVRADDDEVDDLNRIIHEAMLRDIQSDPVHVQAKFAMAGVAQQLERIADIATAIGECVLYLLEGEIKRHQKLRSRMQNQPNT